MAHHYTFRAQKCKIRILKFTEIGELFKMGNPRAIFGPGSCTSPRSTTKTKTVSGERSARDAFPILAMAAVAPAGAGSPTALPSSTQLGKRYILLFTLVVSWLGICLASWASCGFGGVEYRLCLLTGKRERMQLMTLWTGLWTESGILGKLAKVAGLE
jgi:hypothetical protein